MEEDLFNKIDGMFCCIFKEKNKLTIATDFFGEKPLYLYDNGVQIYYVQNHCLLLIVLI